MPNSQEFSQDVDIDFAGLFVIIWKKKWRILAAGLIAGLALMFVLTLVTPKYQGSTRILIEDRESLFTRSGPNDTRRQFDYDAPAIVSHVEIIRSDNIAIKVIETLRLADRGEYNAPIRMWNSTDLKAFLGLGPTSESTPAERALIRFNQALTISTIKDSRVIQVRFNSSDPAIAKAVPNAVAEEYLLLQRKAKQATSQTATKWLGPEIEALRGRVKTAESRVAEFRANSDILVGIGNNNALLSTQQLSEISTELSRLRAERSSAEANVASIRAALSSGSSLDVIPEVIASPLVQRLRENEVTLRTQISDLSTSLLPNHPRLKALKSQVSDMQKQIRRAASDILKSLDNNVDFARKKESELLGEVNRLKSEVSRVDEANVELRVLEREATAEREQLQNYLRNFREASSRQSDEYSTVNARIISRATLPTQPYFPKIIPFAIAGAVLTMVLHLIGILASSLVSGAGLKPSGAISREMVPEPVEKLPELQNDVPGLMTDDPVETKYEPVEPRFETPEPVVSPERDFFAIRYAAEGIQTYEHARILVLTPSIEENKSTAGILARTLANSGKTAVLIDLTADGGSSLELLGRSDLPGIRDVLSGSAQFRDVVYKGEETEAHIIPIGVNEPVAGSDFSARLGLIIDTLEERFDYLLIDCGGSTAKSVASIAEKHSLIVINGNDKDQRLQDKLEASLRDSGFNDIILVHPDEQDLLESRTAA